MSGVNRNIKADITKGRLTGSAAMSKFSASNIRAERGTASEARAEGKKKRK